MKAALRASTAATPVGYTSDPIAELLVLARVQLLLLKPFFGALGTRLILVEAPWCNTAATEGKHFFYNREFIKKLKLSEIMFLVAHEIMHVVMDHIGRRGGRDKDLWNMSADYVVNFSLVKEKVGTMPEGGLWDKDYTDEMTAEEVYDLLKSRSVEIKLPLDEHLDVGADSGDGNGDGDGQGGDDGQDQDGDQDGQGGDDGQDQDGEGESQQSGGKSGGGTGKPSAKPGNGKGQREATVRVLGGKNGPPKISEAELEKIKNAFRAAVVQTAQSVGAGNVPLGVRRLIQNLTEPQLDWRTLIDAHIRSALKDDYTFQRISRKSWSLGGPLLPAQSYEDEVEIFLAIDASGSTTEEMVRDFLSEVLGITDAFRSYKIHVVSFDTEVYNYQVFTPENRDDIYSYEIRGGGGTLFEAVYEWLKREGIEPQRIAFLTDGLPNSTWGDPNYSDTIFIIHSNKHITAPYGLTCHYEPKPKKVRQAAWLQAA